MKKNKRGRPPISNPVSHLLKTLVTPSEACKVILLAQKEHMTVSAWIRQLIRKHLTILRK